MPGLKTKDPKWRPIQISDFSRGLRQFPRLNNEFATFQNLYIREDGYVVGRGRLVMTQQNFGTEVPQGVFITDPNIGFNYVVPTNANWYSIALTNQTPPIQYASRTIKSFGQGPHPAFCSGMNKANQPAIFFSGAYGTDTSVYQYDITGSLTTLSAWTNQLWLGYWNNTLFGGGGKSGAFTNSILYSAPNDPTTQPAANLTAVTSPLGGIPIDFVVINDYPIIITTSGISSLLDAGSGGYPSSEKASFRDQILVRSAAQNGTKLYAMGLHGVYSLQANMEKLEPPLNFYYPPVGDLNPASLSFGRASFSCNGYFYAVVLNNSTNGSSVKTPDNGLLVFDSRLNYWFFVNFPSFAPMFIAPGGPDMGTGGFYFDSFCLVGYDLINSRYSMAFWQLTNGDKSSYQDLPVTSTGGAGTPINYVTEIKTANLFDGNQFTEKSTRDLVISGASQSSNVQVTLSGNPNLLNLPTPQTIQQWGSQQLPFISAITGMQEPMIQYVIDLIGAGDMIIKGILLTYRNLRIATADQATVNLGATATLTGVGSLLGQATYFG